MNSLGHNPLQGIIDAQGVLILDGGLATTLEQRGLDLDDPLWSARILMTHPEIIREVHRDFLEAGADCVIAATYQASFEGFERHGLSAEESASLMRLAVDLAVEARDTFWADRKNHQGRMRPLVAASIGPYGAFLADGSEYRGDYGIGSEELETFHRKRWRILAESRADLLACETLPSAPEAEVLIRLLQETPHTWAWFCFTARDPDHISDGSFLVDVASRCAAEDRVAGVGVNCSAPDLAPGWCRSLRAVTEKPVILYPNAGEVYNALSRHWEGDSSAIDWENDAAEWARAGASVIGGCCRTGPEAILRVRAGTVA